MNAPMPKTLAEKAMLVRLTRGLFLADVTDKDATNLVEHSTGVRKVGRFRKKLLVNSVKFKNVVDAYTALYTYHQKHTLPWTDAGPRLLPATAYFDYTNEMRKLRAACDNVLSLLRVSWAQEVDEDRLRLGNMFVPSDYPADIGSRFYHELAFMPVPDAGDFRVTISPEDMESLENAIHAAERGATKHVIESLLEPLQSAAQKLSVPIGAKGAIFRDTLIENIAEVVDRLPGLDISEDPRVAEAIAKTKELVDAYYGREAELRESPLVRAKAASEAQAKVDDILKNFGGLL